MSSDLFGVSSERLLQLSDSLRRLANSVDADMTRGEIARRLREYADELENATSGAVRAYGLERGTAHDA